MEKRVRDKECLALGMCKQPSNHWKKIQVLWRSQTLLTVLDTAQWNCRVPSESRQLHSRMLCSFSVGGGRRKACPFFKASQKVFCSAYLLCSVALRFTGCEMPSVGLVNWCGLSEFTRIWFKSPFVDLLIYDAKSSCQTDQNVLMGESVLLWRGLLYYLQN